MRLLFRQNFGRVQAYIKKGHTPIQVLPVSNVYTTYYDKTSKNTGKCTIKHNLTLAYILKERALI